MLKDLSLGSPMTLNLEVFNPEFINQPVETVYKYWAKEMRYGTYSYNGMEISIGITNLIDLLYIFSYQIVCLFLWLLLQPTDTTMVILGKSSLLLVEEVPQTYVWIEPLAHRRSAGRPFRIRSFAPNGTRTHVMRGYAVRRVTPPLCYVHPMHRSATFSYIIIYRYMILTVKLQVQWH